MAPAGEAHHNRTLTWEIVQRIRESDDSYAQLAAQYGVDRSTIRLVVQNATWHDPSYTPRPRARGRRRIER